MRIQAAQVRNFRSVRAAGLNNCGGLNILIGKNNAGKSNLLFAIELLISHLKNGFIAVPWASSQRAKDDFTDRDVNETIRIGIQFDLPSELNQDLRNALMQEMPNLERSIEQISASDQLTFIVAGTLEQGRFFRFIEQISAGPLETRSTDISAGGIKLLTVPKSA